VPIVSGGAPTSFPLPPGVIQREVCSVSGTEPSQWCRGGTYTEFFASDQPPLPASQDLLRRVNIDTWTGLIAGNACQEFITDDDDLVMNVSDKWGREWLRSGAGRDWLEAHDLPRRPFFAPDRECSESDPRPVLQFSNLNESSVIIDSSLPIQGVIDVKNGSFTGWRLEYGAGPNPEQWNTLAEGTNAFPNPSLIYTWNLQGITENKVTLRLYLSNGEDHYAERRVTITLNIPTPTSLPTMTPTVTEFPPTLTPTTEPPTAAPPTNTLPPPIIPTETPTQVETPTESPTPNQ
jgi:hypothetical protein